MGPVAPAVIGRAGTVVVARTVSIVGPVYGGADEGSSSQSANDAGGDRTTARFGGLWSGDGRETERRCGRKSSQGSGCSRHDTCPSGSSRSLSNQRSCHSYPAHFCSASTVFLKVRFLFFA